ncbi:MAG: hypothetical protein ACTSRZ_03475 [Promethearchaeota archaeon]
MRRKIISIIILLAALSFLSLGLFLNQQSSLAGTLEKMTFIP